MSEMEGIWVRKGLDKSLDGGRTGPGFLPKWEIQMKSTKNQKTTSGAPTKNQRPRFLKVIMAYTTIANHPAARTPLAWIA